MKFTVNPDKTLTVTLTQHEQIVMIKMCRTFKPDTYIESKVQSMLWEMCVK